LQYAKIVFLLLFPFYASAKMHRSDKLLHLLEKHALEKPANLCAANDMQTNC